MSSYGGSPPLCLCSLCKRQIAGEESQNVEVVEHSYQCALCFGILDPDFISEVASAVETELASLPYDATSFILALNLPISQTLREMVIKQARPDMNGILITVPFKIRNVDAYISKLSQKSGLRPTLTSDLQLLLTLENDEFETIDKEFLSKEYPNDFRVGKKRRLNSADEAKEFSKVQLSQVINRITPDVARKYVLNSPTRPCTFSIAFERDPVFLAGRYCKFSRSLPQSPWSAEEKEAPKEPGNSVSEKVCDVLVKEFGASDSTFIGSGREDIDVRMLGEGRPFAVELKNCRFTGNIKGVKYVEYLRGIEAKVNEHLDINITGLTRVTRKDVEQLTTGQEEKRKWYTAFCYSSEPLTNANFEKALAAIPVEVIQKTPVRVLKRRSLLDRPRSVYSMEILRHDDHHFLVKLETQAGTYIKELVHGDFGRTKPSLADLLGVENGEVDILELDVERVDQVWPPPVGFLPNKIRYTANIKRIG